MLNQSLEERVMQMEKDCRDLRRSILMLSAGTVTAALVGIVAGGLASAVGLAIAAGVVVATMETRRTIGVEAIRARKLEIVGTDGSTRVFIGETTDGTGAVAIYDATGRALAALHEPVRAASSSRRSPS
jgi:hypothetical protein